MNLNLRQQLTHESNGADAAHRGVRREDCPYPERSSEWTHWVYGWDKAMAPTAVHEDGRAVLMSTAAGAKLPDKYFWHHPDGRFTTQDGKPAVLKEST